MIQDLINKVLEQVNSNQFLSGGLVLGAITSLFYSLRAIPAQIWARIRRKIIFEVTIEQQEDLYAYLQMWIHKNYSHELRSVKATFWRIRKSEAGNEVISIGSTDSKKQYRTENQVIFNHYGDSFNFFYKNRLLRISSDKEKFENASNVSSMFFEKYHISGLLAGKAIHHLLSSAAQQAIDEEQLRERPNIKYNSYDGWSTDQSANLRDINSIFIPKDQKEAILTDINNFISNQDFYIKRNIPNRRGYLLHGPPGTGKSSLVSAIAALLKRDLYTLNLKSVDSDLNFIRIMASIRPGSILLFEDIDAYFKQRDDKNKVSFSTFLNELSGVRSKNDLLLFVTTNHKNDLDSALLRPGRLDMHFEIDYPTSKEISEYLSWFYDRPVEIETDKQFSMANIENICCQHKFCFPAALIQIQSKKQLVA